MICQSGTMWTWKICGRYKSDSFQSFKMRGKTYESGLVVVALDVPEGAALLLESLMQDVSVGSLRGLLSQLLRIHATESIAHLVHRRLLDTGW